MSITCIDVRPLYEWLSMRGLVPKEADALFVLGAGSMSPMHAAVDLYKDRRAGKIAFISSGGTFGGNLVFGTPEVEAYSNEALRLGVREDDLIFPEGGMSTNTLEEAKAALPFMEERLGRKPKRVILCSRPVHQRRAWATFRRHNPGITLFNQPGKEEPCVELLPRMVQEIERLEKYGAQGDLEPQVIPEWARKIYDKIRALPMPA